MHPYGPPRKFFRPSGGRGGARLPNPGSAQDFTVDHDTPPGGFHQSQPYLPPPPIEGAPYGFPPGPRPPFHRYPPPHFGYYPRPPGFGHPPQHWRGRGGYGHPQGRGGGWRGRGRSSGGFRGRGGRYHSRQGGDGGSFDDINAYYSRSMFEDPWKDLLPQGDKSEEIATPTSLDGTTSNQDGATTADSSLDQQTAASKVGSLEAGKDDIKAENHSVISHGVESKLNLSTDIDTSDGRSSGGNGNGAPAQAILAGTNGSPPNCVKNDCHSTIVADHADGNKTEDSGDHLCVTSTDQESSQAGESTCTNLEIQD